MVPFDSETGVVSQALVRAGWLPLADRLTAGVCHDLNGRASALSGLVQLLDLDTDLDIRGLLSTEVEKLDEVARLLRLLVGDPDGEAEPLVPSDLVPSLMALQERERGMEDVRVSLTVAADVPPVLVNWTLFARGFLLLLSTVGQEAARGERQVEVALERAEAGGLDVRISGAAVEPTAAWVVALQDALRHDEARVEWDGRGGRVGFPSLAQSREARDPG